MVGNVFQDWCVERSRRPKTETNNLEQKMCYHPCRRTADGRVGTEGHEQVGKLASWSDFAEACAERVMQRQFGETHGDMC